MREISKRVSLQGELVIDDFHHQNYYLRQSSILEVPMSHQPAFFSLSSLISHPLAWLCLILRVHASLSWVMLIFILINNFISTMHVKDTLFYFSRDCFPVTFHEAFTFKEILFIILLGLNCSYLIFLILHQFVSWWLNTILICSSLSA